MKWICKICGESQNVQKVYFIGSGPDCRAETQRLSMAQTVGSSLPEESLINTPKSSFMKSDPSQENRDSSNVNKSKWSEFL